MFVIVNPGVTSLNQDTEFSNNQVLSSLIYGGDSIHPLGPYSVQSVVAAEAESLVFGHNAGRVTTPTQDTSMLALILPTSEE